MRPTNRIGERSDPCPRWNDNRSRGVSDVVGFTLMFGIIMLSVGVVSVGGLGDVLEFGDREEVRTGERGMEAAASTLATIERQGDPNKGFELVMGTGRVEVLESTFEFEGDGQIDDLGDDGTVQINALGHQFDRSPDDIVVSYESGGVFRSDTVTARSEPAMICDGANDVAVISVVNITTDDTIDLQVDFPDTVTLDPYDPPEGVPVADFASTVGFQADLIDTERYRGANVNINVSETLNPTPWENTLENNGWEENDGLFECGTEDAVVRITTIELSQERLE